MRANLFGLKPNSPPLFKALVSGQISIAQWRALRPLPENAGKLIDDAVNTVGLDRLVVVADLIDEGLVYNLGDDFWGITQIQWDEINRTGYAHRTMDPQARGEYQMPDRRPRVLPVYLTWDDFELGIRAIRASERAGTPLDTTLIQGATRNVNEAIEDAAINGVPFNVFGATVPGLLGAPNANSFTYGSNLAWDDPTKTGQAIVNDVLGMIALAQSVQRYGPFNLYLPTTYGNVLNKNFSDGVTTFQITVLQRLEQIMAGGRPLRIRVADMLPVNRTVMVQMTSDVIDVVIGQQPTPVSWDDPSGFSTNWMVLSCVIPRIKSTHDDKSGIVYGNV